MRRIERIRRVILNEVKPKGCKVRFTNKQSPTHHDLSFYEYASKTAVINRRKRTLKKYPYDLLLDLLHEICHYKTWKKEWGKHIKEVGKEETRRCLRSNRYLCEYKTEKLLRKICRKYNWHEILFLSDQRITSLLPHVGQDDKLSVEYIWGWDYAVERIAREEF